MNSLTTWKYCDRLTPSFQWSKRTKSHVKRVENLHTFVFTTIVASVSPFPVAAIVIASSSSAQGTRHCWDTLSRPKALAPEGQSACCSHHEQQILPSTDPLPPEKTRFPPWQRGKCEAAPGISLLYEKASCHRQQFYITQISLCSHTFFSTD